MFATFLGLLALFSLGLTLWQFAAALRFPVHQRPSVPAPVGGVTVLKPLKGCDDQTAACLRSWLAQDYPGPVQFLFGVAAPDDPVCTVVRGLIREYPEADAQLVLCPESLGHNAKVCTLVQLDRHARHDTLVISDADVFAHQDALTQLVAPLSDPRIGLNNCLYRLAGGKGFAMRWEAFSANVDFWSQVLQSLDLKPMDFALGAALATTRRHLNAVGGFSALVDFLADDYQLGRRIAATGAQIQLCSVVVECRTSLMSFAEVWGHQLRWARTIRVCRPGPYFLSILSNATLWPLAWWAVARSPWATATAGLCLVVRLGTAFFIQRKMAGASPAQITWAWLPPVKDLLQVILWAMAFLGNRVGWRGKRFRVLPSGKLSA